MLERILNKITPYSFFIGLGFVFSIIFVFIYLRKNKAERENVIYIYVLSSVVGFIGAKVFYIVTIFDDFIYNLQTNGFGVIGYYIFGGFVFYGGLIFGYLTAIYLLKYYKANKQICVPALIIAALINFGFGRLGCLTVGCCHGAETTSVLSIMYHNSAFAPNGVKLIPVQLYETIFDWILAFVIYRMSKTIHEPIYYCMVHLFSYCIFRFIIEFFRGDLIRGIWLGLSTSQWISLFIVITVIIVFVYQKKHKLL